MEFDQLRKEMMNALKSGDKGKKDVLSNVVAAVKKVAIDEGTRDNISNELVDRAILKEVKTIQEQIDTCPESRTDLLDEYKKKFAILSEYAPKLMDEDAIKAFINDKFADILATKNKGLIMKTIMPMLKGKADGKLINKIIAEMCE